MSGLDVSSWITRPAAPAASDLQLFCFPRAGGSASLYRTWPAGLPSQVAVCPVQLPGRDNRVLERRFVRLGPLVDVLFEVLRPRLDVFALFGHSMGALIAFELARRLEQEGGPRPVRLFVSGHRAPHLPNRHPMIHALPESEFVGELRRLNGTPDKVLDQDELRDLMLPLLRADFAIAETYVHVAGERLECPVVALGGRDDPLVSEREISAWEDVTRGPFRKVMVTGDHFFLERESDLVLDAVRADLRPILASVARAAR